MHTFRPIIAQIPVGKHSFCSCGLSENKPYCDGQHKSAETTLRPIRCEFDEEKRATICDCGLSRLKPFCDGNHMACRP